MDGLQGLELTVITFFHGVIQVCCRMYFTIILNFFITLEFHHFTILQVKAIKGIFQVFFFHQHTLESFRIEAEGGATF